MVATILVRKGERYMNKPCMKAVDFVTKTLFSWQRFGAEGPFIFMNDEDEGLVLKDEETDVGTEQAECFSWRIDGEAGMKLLGKNELLKTVDKLNIHVCV